MRGYITYRQGKVLSGDFINSEVKEYESNFVWAWKRLRIC